MLDMAIPRKKKKMSTATKPRVRIGRNIHVWIAEELFDAFETLRAKTRLTTKAQIEVILEQFLAKEGLWPPPDEIQE